MISPSRTTIVLLAIVVLVVLLASVSLALHWSEVDEWLHGYRVTLLDEGVVPVAIAANTEGNTFLAAHVGDGKNRVVRWTLAGREWVPLRSDDRALTGALAINGDGGIVGSLRTPMSYLWTLADGVRELETLGDPRTVPSDVNDRGEVVGWAVAAQLGKWRATLWDIEGGIRDLGGLTPSGESAAQAISNRGWVVGQGKAADSTIHPLLWKPAEPLRDLGVLPGFNGGSCVDINDRGEVLVRLTKAGPVVGASTFYLGALYLWGDETGFRKVATPSGFSSFRGVAINNRGAILLQGSNPPSRSLVGFIVHGESIRELPVPHGVEQAHWKGLSDNGWLIGNGSPGVTQKKYDLVPERGFLVKLLW